MSMNLVLKKEESLNFTPFQTPTYVSYAAKESGDITAYYKKWADDRSCGMYPAERDEHFADIDRLLSEGCHWTIT